MSDNKTAQSPAEVLGIDVRHMIHEHLKKALAGAPDPGAAANAILLDYAEVQNDADGTKNNTSHISKRTGMKKVLMRLGVSEEMLKLFQGQIRSERAAQKPA
jgi:hypothetical protein